MASHSYVLDSQVAKVSMLLAAQVDTSYDAINLKSMHPPEDLKVDAPISKLLNVDAPISETLSEDTLTEDPLVCHGGRVSPSGDGPASPRSVYMDVTKLSETLPPPVWSGAQWEYEVERILRHRETKVPRRKAKLEYLVQWKGYGPEHNTWEPEANLTNAHEAVQEYCVASGLKPAGAVSKVKGPVGCSKRRARGRKQRRASGR
jgi:Chromo (CHRromatin Organisation MOdifier) domain